MRLLLLILLSFLISCSSLIVVEKKEKDDKIPYKLNENWFCAPVASEEKNQIALYQGHPDANLYFQNFLKKFKASFLLSEDEIHDLPFLAVALTLFQWKINPLRARPFAPLALVLYPLNNAPSYFSITDGSQSLSYIEQLYFRSNIYQNRKISLLDLADFIDRNGPNSLRVNQTLAKDIKALSQILAQLRYLKLFYFKNDEALRTYETMPSFSLADLIYESKKIAPILGVKSLLGTDIFESVPSQCEKQLPALKKSPESETIFYYQNFAARSKKGIIMGSYFESFQNISYLENIKRLPLFNTSSQLAKDQSPPVSVCYSKEKDFLALSSSSSATDQLIISLFKNLKAQISFEEIRDLLLAPRKILLNDPPRILVEADFLDASAWEQITRPNIPLYAKPPFGEIISASNQAKMFFVDPRSEGQLSCNNNNQSTIKN